MLICKALSFSNPDLCGCSLTRFYVSNFHGIGQYHLPTVWFFSFSVWLLTFINLSYWSVSPILLYILYIVIFIDTSLCEKTNVQQLRHLSYKSNYFFSSTMHGFLSKGNIVILSRLFCCMSYWQNFLTLAWSFPSKTQVVLKLSDFHSALGIHTENYYEMVNNTLKIWINCGYKRDDFATSIIPSIFACNFAGFVFLPSFSFIVNRVLSSTKRFRFRLK